MVTTSYYLDDRRGDAPYQLTLRLTHMRTTAYIRLGIRLNPEQWNGSQVVKHPRAGMLNNQLMANKAEIDCQLYELDRKGILKGKKASEIKELLEEKENDSEGMTFGMYFKQYMERKSGLTRHTYEYTYKVLAEYRNIHNMTPHESSREQL